MISRRPFTMVAEKEIRFLILLGPKRSAGGRLVVVLGDIAGFGVEVPHLHEDAVFVRDLLFCAQGQIRLFKVIVRAIAVLGAITGVEGISEIAELAVLRTLLQPIAVTLIFRAGENAQAVGNKESRMLLLRNVLRKVSAADRRQQVGEQQFTEPRRFIAQITKLRV